MTYGERIIGLRLERGMSRHELARKSFVSVTGIQCMETGHTKCPSPDCIKSIANVLGTTVQYILNGNAWRDKELKRIADWFKTDARYAHTKLKEYRIAKGYSIAKLAKAADVTALSIQRAEQGISKPQYQSILRISKVLCCNPLELLEGEIVVPSKVEEIPESLPKVTTNGLIKCADCLSWRALYVDKDQTGNFGCCKVFRNVVTPKSGFCWLAKLNEVQKPKD